MIARSVPVTTSPRRTQEQELARIPRLLAADPTPRGLTRLDPACADVEPWADQHGDTFAYSASYGGWHRIDFPRLASFFFEDPGHVVRVVADGHPRPDRVRDIFRRFVVPMVLQSRGLEVLHASAVAVASGVVALAAVSGTGKSTIAFGLGQRGYPVWADDALVFNASAEGIAAVCVPFRIRLRSSGIWPGGGRGGVRRARAGSCSPVSAVVALTQSPHVKRVEIERVRSSAAFRAVFAHAYSLTLGDQDRKRLMVEHYLTLSARVPAFQLCFPPGIEVLPSILDRIERTVSEVFAPRA
jgi:hypothetical protein